MSIKDETIARQDTIFGDDPEYADMKAKTTEMYERVSDLSPEQRLILEDTVMHKLYAAIRTTDPAEPGNVMGLLMSMSFGMGLIGYSHALTREEANITSVQDTAVDAVLALGSQLLQEQAIRNIAPEHRDRYRAAVAKADEAAARGEDYDEALNAEVQSIQHELYPELAQASAKSSSGEYGMYL